MILLERDVEIRLRDGTSTRANVWRPDTSTRVPAVLVRTPYTKEQDEVTAYCDPRKLVPAGFAVVSQDVRGRGGSEGTFTPFAQEFDDGYDSVEAVAAMSWCSGEVVMAGNSYVGATQWLAAAAGPPSLGGIAPALTTTSYDEGWTFTGGVLELAFIGSWVAGTLAAEPWLDDVERSYWDRESLLAVAPWVRQWLEEPPGSPYWESISAEPRRDAIRVPALSIGGWYDIFVAGTLRAFAADRHPASRLIVGPWAHDDWMPYIVGESNLGWAGSGEAYGFFERLVSFYRAVLAGADPPLPRVSAYVIGGRRWLEAPSWPPPVVEPFVLPLRGTGSFSFDPASPPPSIGGRALRVNAAGGPGWGAFDQRQLALHPDVVHLRSAPLAEALLLAGRVRVSLATAATGDELADWVCTLCTRATDGELLNLCEGIARAQADAASVIVDLGDICVELPKGAELHVLVAGGSFPRWEPLTLPRSQTVDGAQLLLEAYTGG